MKSDFLFASRNVNIVIQNKNAREKYILWMKVWNNGH